MSFSQKILFATARLNTIVARWIRYLDTGESSMLPAGSSRGNTISAMLECGVSYYLPESSLAVQDIWSL